MLPVKITAATSYWAKEKEKNEEKQTDSEVGICQTCYFESDWKQASHFQPLVCISVR